MRIYWHPEREQWVTEKEMVVILNLTTEGAPVGQEDRIKAIHEFLKGVQGVKYGKDEQDREDSDRDYEQDDEE